ncbi:MAG: hypothetical protein ACXWZB_04510 [Gaiellaceae bacterium]
MRVLLAVAVASLAFAADAFACSCAPVDLERDLPGADAAVIGTVLERRATDSTATYLLRVEQVYKGELDGRVEVVTAADGAACGLEVSVGERIGLLLDRTGGEWRSGLCQQVDPADFLALTEVEDNQLPEFNWGGIVVGTLVLVGGTLLVLWKARSYRRLR